MKGYRSGSMDENSRKRWEKLMNTFPNKEKCKQWFWFTQTVHLCFAELQLPLNFTEVENFQSLPRWILCVSVLAIVNRWFCVKNIFVH